MTLEEAQNGVRMAHEEAKKGNLNGQVLIRLTYQNGGIAKATKEVIGNLLPGVQPTTRPDFEGRSTHGG